MEDRERIKVLENENKLLRQQISILNDLVEELRKKKTSEPITYPAYPAYPYYPDRDRDWRDWVITTTTGDPNTLTAKLNGSDLTNGL